MKAFFYIEDEVGANRAVGKIRAESATSPFLRDSLLLGTANRYFGAKWAENVPME